MERDESSRSRTWPCPSCARELPTRVLADPVTLVVVGVCPEHGTAELSRVRLSVAEVYPAEAPRSAVPATVAYRPGDSCGRHLGAGRSCSLPTGHAEPHAG